MVVQVDVGMAGRAVEQLVATGGSRRRVTRRVGLADVGFDLHDDAAGEDAAAVVHEHEAEKIAGDVKGRAVVESSRGFHITTLNAETAESAEQSGSASSASSALIVV
jgi:hypothetical protein